MDSPSVNEITLLLRAWSHGDEHALEQVTPLVYNELKQLARAYMAREKSGNLLQRTALINETSLRLIRMKAIDWQDRKHFYVVCAQLMRRILTDYARSRLYLKRGGDAPYIPFDDRLVWDRRPPDFVALDDALRSLAILDPRKSRVVELRFFGGFSVEESAELLNVSERTVKQDWQVAKLWLLHELNRANGYE
jgi:RNA polymerase sigma-70 factor (ECF subfamily)